MKQITDKTELIIGIDFGHGETSAALYGLKDNKQADIDIFPGRKAIKSAVAILEQEGQETICVGEDAINRSPFAKDFQISFKKRPSEMSKVERNRMVSFMKGVYACIIKEHPEYQAQDHAVYIARPSQDSLWKNEEAAYIAMAEEAGIPVAGIQKESRAAYFRARTQPNSKIDQHVKKGVLIVDYGSSTIDFTYLNESLSAPRDDGCQLGAGRVEELLLDYAMANPDSLNTTMREFAKLYCKDKFSKPYNMLLFAFRKTKEEFYSGVLKDFTMNIYYGDLTSSEKEQLHGFGRISIPRDKVDEILGKNKEGGYIQKVKEAVIELKNKKLKGQTVACVYMTGGASRMDFVREIFMEVFGLDDAHCPKDNNPELIVSQGVAHLSYADISTKGKEAELRKIAQDAISGFNWDANLSAIIRSSIKAKIIDKAWSIMIDYRDGRIGEYLTLTDDHSAAGEFINMDPDYRINNGYTGYFKVRNIRSLRKKFKSEFDYMVHYDFVSACESTITQNVVDSVVNKLKAALSVFAYNSTNSPALKLTGLSAYVTSDGAAELSTKFTAEGKGHIIYDAVDSCYLAMGKWNLHKDRWDSDRKQHYEYYRANYKDIFSSYGWEQFLKNKISISGIPSAKQQTQRYIDDLIDEYVSYAKLAIFFKSK